jgi:hypothetical protein
MFIPFVIRNFWISAGGAQIDLVMREIEEPAAIPDQTPIRPA